MSFFGALSAWRDYSFIHSLLELALKTKFVVLSYYLSFRSMKRHERNMLWTKEYPCLSVEALWMGAGRAGLGMRLEVTCKRQQSRSRVCGTNALTLQNYCILP
jgi:hypothetical protein